MKKAQKTQKGLKSKAAARPRPSAASTSSKARSASAAGEDVDSDDQEVQEVQVSSRKRGRASAAKASNIASDSEEVDEPPVKSRETKKSKSASSAPRKRQETAASEIMDLDDDDESGEAYIDMKKWQSAASWENLVKSIDTVERAPNGALYVYFTLWVAVIMFQTACLSSPQERQSWSCQRNFGNLQEEDAPDGMQLFFV